MASLHRYRLKFGLQRFATVMLVTCLLLLSVPPAEIDSQDLFESSLQVDEARIQQTLESLTQHPTRLLGTTGASTAADYMEQRLEASGVASIQRQEVSALVPGALPFQISVDAGGSESLNLSLHPLWPNGAQVVTLPPEGLSGHLVYADSGSLDHLAGLDLNGAIVLLNTVPNVQWQLPFVLGANAVIFMESRDGHLHRRTAETLFLDVPADLPRFWLPAAEAGSVMELVTTDGHVTAEITGRGEWIEAKGHNIIAYIDGTDPELRDETVVISAPYDANSVVPGLAPGAEQAVSATVLLEIADYLKANPPRRSVVLLATTGHGQGLVGIREFVNHQIAIYGSGPSRQFSGRIEADTDISPDYLGTDIRSIHFFGLSLRSDGSGLGLFHRGHYYEERQDFEPDTVHFTFRRFEPLASYIVSTAEKILSDLGHNGTTLVNAIHDAPRAGWDASLPSPMAFDAEVVTLAGGSGLTLATVGSHQPVVDTPFDQLHAVNIPNVVRQAEIIIPILDSVLNAAPDALPSPPSNADFFHRLELTTTLQHSDDEYGTMLSANWGSKTTGGVRGHIRQIADENGHAMIAGVPAGHIMNHLILDVAAWRRETGQLVGFLDEGVAAQNEFTNPNRAGRRITEYTLPVFPGAVTTLSGMPDVASAATPVWGLDGQILGQFAYRQDGMIGTAVTPSEGQRWLLQATTGRGERFVLSNSDSNAREGSGFASGEAQRISHVPLRTSEDMWRLNDWRLNILQGTGIAHPALLHDHRIVERLMDRSRQALAAKDYAVFYPRALGAQQLGGNLVPRVEDVAEQAGYVLTYYLFLALPFAYFLTRVMVPTVYGLSRLILVAALYAAVFLLFYLLHPSFALGLDFPYFALSTAIMAVVFLAVYHRWGGILDRWLAALGPQRYGLSRVRPHPLPTLAAAFNLGVENIARRRARSFLTALAITLMTVAMVLLVALQPHLGPERRVGEGVPPYDGFLIRGQDEDGLPEAMLTNLPNWYQGTFDVTPRAERTVSSISWTAESPWETGSGPSVLFGLSAAEPAIPSEALLTHGRWLISSTERAVVLPQGAVPEEQIPALLGSTLELAYVPLEIVGFFDETLWDNPLDLDGRPFTPYLPGRGTLGEERQLASGGDIVVTGFGTALLLDALPTSVALTLTVPEEPFALAEELAAIFQHEVTVGDGAERYRILPATASQASLTVPFGVIGMIAGLMILNVMLGAVAERSREIRTYGSVGMSPGHVTALVMAEAMVFAVLGVGAGYLGAQLASKGLALSGVLPDITLNITSWEAVYISGIMLLMVLISAVYPALLAGRISAPGFEEVWELAGPKDGVFHGELPFAVANGHELAINGFLADYFDEETKKGSRRFFVRDIELFPAEEFVDGYRLECELHMAPFDAGVNQTVCLETIRNKDGQFHVRYSIERLTGNGRAWERCNRAFMSDLRRQYLLWNTLHDAQRKHYKELGLELLAPAPGAK